MLLVIDIVTQLEGRKTACHIADHKLGYVIAIIAELRGWVPETHFGGKPIDMARAAILSVLVLGAIAACAAKTDTSITSRVYFDVDIDGKPAGACVQRSRPDLCSPSTAYSIDAFAVL